MSGLFTDDELPYVQTSRPLWSVLFRLDTTGDPLRVWAGVGDLLIPADAVEVSSAVYKGGGQVVGMEELSALINGLAERKTFNLSGVPASLLAYVDTEADSIRFGRFRIGIAIFKHAGPGVSDAWARAAGIKWIWQGVADSPLCSVTPAEDDGEVKRIISLSVGSNNTGRQRPQQAYVTAPDQFRRSPTDTAMNRINRYASSATRKWPQGT